MKVYVVTSGCYSDYSINAIFSTEELAKEFMAKATKEEYSDNYEIETWEMDARASDEFITVWNVGILLDDGDITEGPRPNVQLRAPFRGGVKQSAVPVHAYGGRLISRVESGVSADHCLKLAVEERQRWLREKK